MKTYYETIVLILNELDLCQDSEFHKYIKDKTEFITPELSEFAGCYLLNGTLVAKVPFPVNNKMKSIAVHEMGHLYDTYLYHKIIDNEDTALLWELKYLYSIDDQLLLAGRLQEIYANKSSNKYKSLIQLKKETK